MAGRDEENAAERAVDLSSKSLSELAARILQQLAISAWLPAVALTLLATFTIEMGSVLDGSDDHSYGSRRSGPGQAVSRTFVAVGGMGVGALVLLLVVVVALTMLTQAFSFEWIRVLEGYWGVSRPMERLAQARARRWRRKRRKLADRDTTLRDRAWRAAKLRLRQREDVTRPMVKVLGRQIKGRRPPAWVTTEQLDALEDIDWLDFVPGDILRRRVNLSKKLADFPRGRHAMPTRLGNVLRHFEDRTRWDSVESAVDEVFDSLPASLRISHDEQRGRLDLYCSMQVALALAGVVALLRFNWHHWGYSVAALVIVGLGLWVFYAAAIASARYYGSLLVTIAEFVRDRDWATAQADLPAADGAGHARTGSGEGSADDSSDDGRAGADPDGEPGEDGTADSDGDVGPSDVGGSSS